MYFSHQFIGENLLRIAQLPPSITSSNSTEFQLALPDIPEADDGGFGMGVLSDGSPFMHQRLLATYCGVENAHIGTISSQWHDVIQKPRIQKIRDILQKRNIVLDQPHVVINKAGRSYYAYSEPMCLAILEYYAFDAGAQCQPQARDNYRNLMHIGFRQFVYNKVGYKPSRQVDDPWRAFHDRLSLTYNAAPSGYFSIFRESAELMVVMGEHGVPLNESILPDISPSYS